MLSSYYAFAAFVLLAVGQVAQATVTYKPDGYKANKMAHALTFNGDQNGYSVTTLPQWSGGPDSDAQCKNTVSNSARLGANDMPLFTGPCQTSTKDHTQVLHVQCIDPAHPQNKVTASAKVTFHRRAGGTGKVIVETQGTFFYGFSNEPKSAELHKSARGVSNTGKYVGVVLSCYNGRRVDRTYP